MSEVIITKEFSFDAAHQLVGHDGKCANLHGHTYRLEIALKATPINDPNDPKDGFVMDFSQLKLYVKQRFLDDFDHAILAEGNEPALPVVQRTMSKHIKLGFRTTCENLARYICYLMKRDNIPVYYVRLWETPTASAIVYADEVGETLEFSRSGGCDVND